MAYEVTATRRRPKTFDEMAGQEFVVATLKSSIESKQIAHAYLFSGPRGCGKTSSARILARSLNCENGPTATPCGVCSSCQEIARGASLDIIEIDGASNTGVNDVRAIKDEVLFPPNSSRYKIYIIDEVHMLSNSAFNALLKTIEEPPPYIVFIFATTELHKVPATIKSRCQQFAFRLIPIETIAGILRDTCKELGIEAEDEALFWIARESTGSMRDAYTLFDQVASFSDGNIRAALIREKLGLLGLETLNALTEACVQNDTKQALLLIDETLNAGVAVEQFVIDLAGYYRSLLFIKAGVTRESLLEYSPERFSATAIAKFTQSQLEHALELLLALYRDIRYSISPRFDLETVVSKLCWLDQWISPQDLSAAIAGLRQAMGASPAVFAGGPKPNAGQPSGFRPPNFNQSGESSPDFSSQFGRPRAAQEDNAPMREVPDRPSLSEGFKRLVASRAVSGLKSGGLESDGQSGMAGVTARSNGDSGAITGEIMRETPPAYTAFPSPVSRGVANEQATARFTPPVAPSATPPTMSPVTPPTMSPVTPSATPQTAPPARPSPTPQMSASMIQGTSLPATGQAAPQAVDGRGAQVERVLRVFGGTIVKNA